MTITLQPATAEDLLRMQDDGFRYELVKGELRKMAPAGHRHGRIILNLATPLDQHVRAHDLGAVYAAETGFRLAPDHVRAPDVAFICRERVIEVGDTEGYWPGAPDLAVEVVSPYDIFTDIEEKVCDWLDHGTHMVVVLNPAHRTATVYRSRTDITILALDDILDGGDIVPGWSLPVKELFT